MVAKKKKGKANATPKEKEIKQEVDMEAASTEELNQKIATLETEKNKEEEGRNLMQLERDKIAAFWEITKKDLDGKRSELRNKDREIEEMEERQQVEIKVYKQKVKHLLYEHQNNVTETKAVAEEELRIRDRHHENENGEWRADLSSLNQRLREQELADQERMEQLKLEHSKETTKLRQSYEQQLRQLNDVAAKKMNQLRDMCELQRRSEIHEIEERKNAHIRSLMHNHERAFLEIKTYYNDITHTNLDLIKTLKQDVSEMKKKEVLNEKLLYEIAQENKCLTEPLDKALKEVEALRRQLESFEDDKRVLAITKGRLSHLQKELKSVDWEKELLTQQLEKVRKERDAIEQRSDVEMFDERQRSSLKEMQLEKSVQSLKSDVEKRDAQIAEIMIATNLDSAAVNQVNSKLDAILESKDSTICSLRMDLARVTKSHNDLIRVYESKLTERGATKEDLGFCPLPSNVSLAPTRF